MEYKLYDKKVTKQSVQVIEQKTTVIGQKDLVLRQFCEYIN